MVRGMHGGGGGVGVGVGVAGCSVPSLVGEARSSVEEEPLLSATDASRVVVPALFRLSQLGTQLYSTVGSTTAPRSSAGTSSLSSSTFSFCSTFASSISFPPTGCSEVGESIVMVIVEGEEEEGMGRHSNGGGSMSNVRSKPKCSNSLQGRRREGVVREGGREEGILDPLLNSSHAVWGACM